MSTEQSSTSYERSGQNDDELVLIDEEDHVVDEENADLVDLTEDPEVSQNGVETTHPDEADLADEDSNQNRDHLDHGNDANQNEEYDDNDVDQRSQQSPDEVDLTEDNEADHDNTDSPHQNGSNGHDEDLAQNGDDDQEVPEGICYNCKERKVFRNNLCYRCRGVAGGNKVTNPSRSKALDYHKSVDDQFLARCNEAAGRRRVSNKPLTFSEEFLSPKRARHDPDIRHSLPTRSNDIILLNGIKEEPMDEEPYGYNLPDLNDQFRADMSDLKSDTSEARMRVCTDCKEYKKHHAKNRCLNCYRDMRKSETALLEEAKKRRSSNSKIRLCVTCRKQKPHYAKERCKQCYQNYRKNMNKYGNITLEDVEEKPSIVQQRAAAEANPPEDFSKYRVCQECKDFSVHFRRGMCRPCYEQSLKNRRYEEAHEHNTRSSRHDRQQSETPSMAQINASLASSSKKTMVGVTRCVVCNSVMQEADLRSQRTIVCRKCHQEGKTRHRWCVGCGQLRVHDGANRCRPCHLAYKKGISRSPVDLTNPRYRGKFDALTGTYSNDVDTSSLSATPQSKKTSRPSATHCVVCEVLLQGSNIWSPTSLTCKKCHATGKERMRWCQGCGMLKFHQAGGRCRDCCNVTQNGDASKDGDFEDMDDNLVDEDDNEESRPNDILAQIGAILNQYSAPDEEEQTSAASHVDTTAETRRSRPAPPPTASNAKIVVPEMSQEDVQQKIDELTNPAAVNCLVCRIPIDFSIQMRNAKICLTCRDKGLQRMRWCVDCNKLKFHQGRGRCQECYRAIRSSGASGQQRLDDDDQAEAYPIVEKTPTAPITRSAVENAPKSGFSKEERQRQFRSRLQELCLEFPDLDEARQLPNLVKHAFNLHSETQESPAQSRQGLAHTRQGLAQSRQGPTQSRQAQSQYHQTPPQSRPVTYQAQDRVRQPAVQNIRQASVHHVRQAPVQVTRQILSQTIHHGPNPRKAQFQSFNERPIQILDHPRQQQSSRPRFIPPPLRPGEPKMGAQCLICPNRIDFSKQLKTAKVCVECTAKNLKRHRWCLDCKKLKPCIGRGRCSFCYTLHMKEQKAHLRSDNYHSVDSTDDFNESNDPEALLQQILQASGIQLESLNANGHNGAEHSGDDNDGEYGEDPDEVERTVSEILGHRPKRSIHAVHEEFGRRGLRMEKRPKEVDDARHSNPQRHFDDNYVTVSSEDES